MATIHRGSHRSATVARTSLARRLFPTPASPATTKPAQSPGRSTPNNPSEVLGATSERPVDSHTSMLVFNSNASVGIGLAFPFSGKAIFGAEQFADRYTAKASPLQRAAGWSELGGRSTRSTASCCRSVTGELNSDRSRRPSVLVRRGADRCWPIDDGNGDRCQRGPQLLARVEASIDHWGGADAESSRRQKVRARRFDCRGTAGGETCGDHAIGSGV